MAEAKVSRKSPGRESKATPNSWTGLAETAARGFDSPDDSIRQIVGGFAEDGPPRGEPVSSASARYGATLGRADRRGVTTVSLLEQLGACEEARSA